MTEQKPALTVMQKIGLLPAVFRIVFKTIGSALCAPFRGQYGQTTLKRHIMLSLMRHGVGELSPEQLQSVMGSTVSNYTAYMGKKGANPQKLIVAGTNTTGMWVGNPDADTVSLYFHGGGFALPGGEDMFAFLSDMVEAASSSGKSLAFLVLQYDLAPGRSHPHQLEQCVELLRYASETLTPAPKQLVLGGDSAGASLVFGTLLHLLHPHPEVAPLKLSRPLRAAFACSPWVDFDMDSARYREGGASDAADVETLKSWARNYSGASAADQWREPAKATARSWEGLGAVVDEILVTAAQKEMMLDDIRAMSSKIQTFYKPLTLFVASDDFHAEPTLGSVLGEPRGDAAEMVTAWLSSKC